MSSVEHEPEKYAMTEGVANDELPRQMAGITCFKWCPLDVTLGILGEHRFMGSLIQYKPRLLSNGKINFLNFYGLLSEKKFFFCLYGAPNP